MQLVELLLAAGADPATRSKDGRTAADWARRRGDSDHRRLAGLLLRFTLDFLRVDCFLPGRRASVSGRS
jgi:hypothetical protein